MQNDLKICGIDLQSYLLLKNDFKPVIRLATTEDARNIIEKNTKKLGLEILIKEFRHFYGEDFTDPIIVAYLSLDKKLCMQAYESERDGKRKKLGLLLGYPECCIDGFIESFSHGKKMEFIMDSLKRTRKKPSFYCSNLFVFDSKLSSFNTEIFKNNMDLFDSEKTRDLFLIRHVPCSFDCEESIGIGKATLKLLKANSPRFAKKIVDALKNPVLYWDYFNWLILDGHVHGDVLKYRKILNYKSLVCEEIKKMVREGSMIKIGDKRMTVFSDAGKIGEITRKRGTLERSKIPVCMDFG